MEVKISFNHHAPKEKIFPTNFRTTTKIEQAVKIKERKKK